MILQRNGCTYAQCDSCHAVCRESCVGAIDPYEVSWHGITAIGRAERLGWHSVLQGRYSHQICPGCWEAKEQRQLEAVL